MSVAEMLFEALKEEGDRAWLARFLPPDTPADDPLAQLLLHRRGRIRFPELDGAPPNKGEETGEAEK